MNLESMLEFTRVRYLALSYSPLYSKLCLVSSALGHPWELLYADDLVISAETEEGLKMKLNKWKTEMEANMGKTKIMVSGVNLQTLKDSGEYPCSVCSNSIYCAGCSHWVHKKCSGVRDANKSTGEKRRYFKYYDDTMNILGDRECVFPTDFAESCNVSAGTSSSTITRISSSSNQAIDDIPAENVVWGGGRRRH